VEDSKAARKTQSSGETNMKSIQTNRGLKVKTSVKASGLKTINHNRRGLKVKTTVKASGLKTTNHSRGALRV
jgi:hypothetical protein